MLLLRVVPGFLIKQAPNACLPARMHADDQFEWGCTHDVKIIFRRISNTVRLRLLEIISSNCSDFVQTRISHPAVDQANEAVGKHPAIQAYGKAVHT